MCCVSPPCFVMHDRCIHPNTKPTMHPCVTWFNIVNDVSSSRLHPVLWRDPTQHFFSCTDPRASFAHLGTFGGDIGEFVLALGVLEHLLQIAHGGGGTSNVMRSPTCWSTKIPDGETQGVAKKNRTSHDNTAYTSHASLTCCLLATCFDVEQVWCPPFQTRSLQLQDTVAP